MENPGKGTTVAMAPGGNGPTVIEEQRLADALDPTSACPNVSRRQMLTAFATTGIVLAQAPMIAPAAAQARAAVRPALPTYFLKVGDFLQSLVEIPADPVKFKHHRLQNTTTATQYLAGIANLYAAGNNVNRVGRCSASFLCFQNAQGTYTDISNYISLENGLIVSWFTPTTLIDLALDSIIHGMVTECIVVASTKIGANPFYGDTFNLKVSSARSGGEEQVQFVFTNLST